MATSRNAKCCGSKSRALVAWCAVIAWAVVPLWSVAAPELSSGASEQPASFLERMRGDYKQAKQLIAKGEFKSALRLRDSLLDYPLLPYLDYALARRQVSQMSGTEARTFVDDHRDSPLGVRFLDHYLTVTGRSRRWGDLLEAIDHPPRSEELKCYYARALRARGRVEEAWGLSESLWLSGRSVHKACDPLFDLWRQAGNLTDQLLWERAKLAYTARQKSLLRYLGSLADEAQRPAYEALLGTYARPNQTLEVSGRYAGDRSADVVVLGLERLSRYQPAQALNRLRRMSPDQLTVGQQRRVGKAIAFRGLLEREDGVRDWIDTQLADWNDDQLTQMRLRWAIREGDFPQIGRAVEYLTPGKINDGVWQYWRARAVEESGNEERAQELYSEAAQKRSYYGFLSADKTGMPYRYNDLSPSSGDALVLQDGVTERTVQRIKELIATDNRRTAHGEWTFLLQRTDVATRATLAALADREAWFRFEIDAANGAEQHDVLAYRFPLAYRREFALGARAVDLPLSEIMAIARRESAFFPKARSSAGARGLMQLMPGTGRAVAKSAGLPSLGTSALYDVSRNITLGTRYYRQLLDEFSLSRPVALAAYNAGPNRVKNWLGDDLPMDQWIETIPFKETRNYVKAVLAYAVIFDHRLGEDASLLTRTERFSRL
ncbi:MAG: transglycosylase SLT domain-containing protein [Pseudomonadota bacterium]